MSRNAPKINICLRNFIDTISKEDYFECLDKLARSMHFSSPHKVSLVDDIFYAMLKDRVIRFKPFIRWGNYAVKECIPKDFIKMIYSCYLAGLAVALAQELEYSSSYVGKSSRTADFRVDLGDLTNRANEWLTAAYKLTGYRPGTNMTVRRLQ